MDLSGQECRTRIRSSSGNWKLLDRESRVEAMIPKMGRAVLKLERDKTEEVILGKTGQKTEPQGQ